jgi:hypothetical protein
MMVHLSPGQKKARQSRAKRKGGSMAAEIRKAVDLYLADLSPDELGLLDQATGRARRDIAEMTESMQRTVAVLDRTFAEIESIRGRKRKGAAQER